MSVGSNLQEMENVVTKGAAKADPMPKAPVPVEDLGGPTPENYKPDDDSAKLKEPAATLAQVRNVVNAKAKAAEEVETEIEDEQEIVAEAEEETTEEEVVSEEEATESEEQEVVAEEETTEEEVVAEAQYDVEEDLNALIAGEELSEEFQEKARTIFETAIKEKVATVKEEMQGAYEAALVEEVETIKSELTERVDTYLEYVAEEWISENQIAIETGLKSEMTESFLSGMKSLFEEHYVTIPEDKYDVLESMVEKLDDMETKLNEQIEKNITLNGRLSEATAEGIFESVSDGLASTQKEKLASLSESVEFESESQYREKLEMLKESYFSTKAPVAKSETLSEGVDQSPEFHSDSMSAYLRTLGSFGKQN